MAAANALTGDARYAAYQKLDLIDHQGLRAVDGVRATATTREFVSARVGGYLIQSAHSLANLNTFFLK